MKVTLMDYTKEAREILIFSKRTRLKMSSGAYQEVCDLSEEEKEKELYYIFSTIGSSWEFVDYTLLIEGVTRAFTHQLVRHRVGVSFAQQAQRVVSMGDFEYLETGGCVGDEDYRQTMKEIQKGYDKLIQKGVAPQDARGVLPTNVLTNILMKINLRSLLSMCELRMCYRAQGEYQTVMKAIAQEITAVHPWLEEKLQPSCIQHGSCPWPRFKECPLKEKFEFLQPVSQETTDHMIEAHKSLGLKEFQPTGK